LLLRSRSGNESGSFQAKPRRWSKSGALILAASTAGGWRP